MALSDPVLLLAGLIELELPSRTVRLCDGGFVNWPARGLFTSSDSAFGTIESVEAISEAFSDEAPGARLTLLPVSTANASDLFQSSAQGRPIQFWLAEVNRQTGLVVGTPTLLFIGMIDFMTLTVGKGTRRVDVEFIAAAERLFFVREGNVLSPRFHNDAWPGEKGFNHASGTAVQTPWGVTGPSRGTIFAPSGGPVFGFGSGNASVST
jgi:hypothetical protein